MTQPILYHPDFKESCRICDTSPCVVVADHAQPRTELCGTCFFEEPKMVDHEKWNDKEVSQDE